MAVLRGWLSLCHSRPFLGSGAGLGSLVLVRGISSAGNFGNGTEHGSA